MITGHDMNPRDGGGTLCLYSVESTPMGVGQKLSRPSSVERIFKEIDLNQTACSRLCRSTRMGFKVYRLCTRICFSTEFGDLKPPLNTLFSIE